VPVAHAAHLELQHGNGCPRRGFRVAGSHVATQGLDRFEHPLLAASGDLIISHPRLRCTTWSFAMQRLRRRFRGRQQPRVRCATRGYRMQRLRRTSIGLLGNADGVRCGRLFAVLARFLAGFLYANGVRSLSPGSRSAPGVRFRFGFVRRRRSIRCVPMQRLRRRFRFARQPRVRCATRGYRMQRLRRIRMTFRGCGCDWMEQLQPPVVNPLPLLGEQHLQARDHVGRHVQHGGDFVPGLPERAAARRFRDVGQHVLEELGIHELNSIMCTHVY
jgi:hypothetical protein